MGPSSVPQTSVRLLPSAVEALDGLRVRRRCSRDQAVRDLLDSFIASQAVRGPRDRLTHVTAVLRYPPLPPGRNRQDGKVRVPLRLSEGVGDAVEDLTLQLPGQVRRRGLKHYARSPLTEAIYSSLSLTYPWQVSGLEGLPAIWTHAAAVGLWRLTIAATLTQPEQRAVLGELDLLDADGEDPTALADLLRNGDLAWHHPWRDEVALHLARNLLTRSDDPDNMRILHEQQDAFEELRFDLERIVDLDHWTLAGAPKQPSSGVKGRGGALVWRGRRRLALRAVGEWLAAGAVAPLVVSPPSARIHHPVGWTSVQVGAGEQLPEPVAGDVEAGRVLLVTTTNKATAWPYSRGTGEPVPWFDLVLEALAGRRSEEIVELVLLDDSRHRTVYLLADEAHALGLIAADKRDSLIVAAAGKTRTRMDTILERSEAWDPGDRAELRASSSDPERFFEIAAKHRQREGIVHPWWEWNAGPTIRELEVRTLTKSQVRKLVERRSLYWKRDLEREMERAGRSAAVGYRVDIDEHTDISEDEAEWGADTVFDIGDLLD